MPTYVYDHELEKVVPKAEYLARKGPLTARSDLPTPSIRSDTLGGINGLWNPSDGNYYDSKSRFEAAVKAKGSEIIGNDRAAAFDGPATKGYQHDRADIVNDIKRAIEETS